MSKDFDVVYSMDAECFVNCAESVDEIKEHVEFYEPQATTVFMGDVERLNITNFLWVENIIENIIDNAMDEYSDVASQYLSNVTNEQKEELSNLINDWATKHSLQPNFYAVVNIREVTLADLDN